MQQEIISQELARLQKENAPLRKVAGAALDYANEMTYIEGTVTILNQMARKSKRSAGIFD